MGGGGAKDAQREAQAAEDARRRQVAQTQQRIDAIYADPNRENDIRDVQSAVQQYLQSDLDRQHTGSARDLKFSLARSGQTMGSVDADMNRDLAEQYLRAGLEVQRRANAAGNSLRQADQTSKLNLFSMAQQGLDAGTAARQAGEAMRMNIAGAKSDAMQSGLGDLFGDFGGIYKRSREKAGEAKAEKYQYGTFYTPNNWYSRDFNFGG